MHCYVVPVCRIEYNHITKMTYTTHKNHTTNKIPYTITITKEFTLVHDMHFVAPVHARIGRVSNVAIHTLVVGAHVRQRRL